jgi:putative ABC transport system permease protein
MVAGNAMVAVGLCYNNMGQRFSSEQQQIQEKLSLARRRRWPRRG